MKVLQTAERVSENEISDHYVYARSQRAYLEAAKLISGDVLEIGSGEGYAIGNLSKQVNKYVALDKFKTNSSRYDFPNVEFLQMTFENLGQIKSESYDFIICFQVLEHIKDDNEFLKQANRILKKGGKFIMTTPNKATSLTRNPWHIREYIVPEMIAILKKHFTTANVKGVYGDEVVNKYYEKNKQAVAKFKKWDIFNLEERLPRVLLQIPYDLLNRMNRKKLATNNTATLEEMTPDNFFIADVNEKCLDYFTVSEK
jgi:2-polyprenyl-3-methyl-5-hydroxy-6-metoxy-1,4-benzoquinol methylase